MASTVHSAARGVRHRGEPGPDGDQADLQRARRSDSGYRETGRAATASVGWINGVKDLRVSYRG